MRCSPLFRSEIVLERAKQNLGPCGQGGSRNSFQEFDRSKVRHRKEGVRDKVTRHRGELCLLFLESLFGNRVAKILDVIYFGDRAEAKPSEVGIEVEYHDLRFRNGQEDLFQEQTK